MMLRVFRPPLPAQVRVQAGAPVYVSASGVSGPVTDCAGPWRASGDWWDVAWSREEWDVTLGGRGLYRTIGGDDQGRERELALLWVLNLSDGVHSLEDVAERARLPLERVREAARALLDAGLLAPA